MMAGHEPGRSAVSMSEVYAFEKRLEDTTAIAVTSLEGRALLSLIRGLFRLLAREHGWRS